MSSTTMHRTSPHPPTPEPGSARGSAAGPQEHRRAHAEPLAVLAALGEGREHVFWSEPEGATYLAIGSALRVEAPAGRPLDLPALGRRLEAAWAERSLQAPEDPRAAEDPRAPEDPEAPEARQDRAPTAFLTVAFDPEAPFPEASSPEAPSPAANGPAGPDSPTPGDLWHGFPAVALTVPEILLTFRGGASARASRTAEAEIRLLAPPGDPQALGRLEAEVDALLAASRAPEHADPAAAGAWPDLVISWRGDRHREKVVAALEALTVEARGPEGPADGSPRPGLSKVVLAHAVEVERPSPFHPAAVVARLARAHPQCFLFSVRPAPGAAVFLGASPERLAQVAGKPVDGKPGGGKPEAGPRTVRSGALAGSAPRGETPEEDAALGRALLASPKDRREQAIVGRMVEEALSPLCLRLASTPEPQLARLQNVQHLFTPIVGTLRPGRGLLDAVQALHPTPAVGGMPRDQALRAIRTLEVGRRGLYAGVVGRVEGDGTGETAVAIRSALVSGPRAVLYAGGGIVATSDPDQEVDETRIKLGAVLGAITPELAGGRAQPAGPAPETAALETTAPGSAAPESADPAEIDG